MIYGNVFAITGHYTIYHSAHGSVHWDSANLAGHHNAQHKYRLGHLDDDPSPDPNAQTALFLDDDSDIGTYYLTPLSVPGDNSAADYTTALRVRRGDDFYFYEFRQPLGWDQTTYDYLRSHRPQDFPADAWNGLLVNIDISSNQTDPPVALDMSPHDSCPGYLPCSDNSDFLDSALRVGQTYADTDTCFSITVNRFLPVGDPANPSTEYPILEVVVDLIDDGDACTILACIDGVPTNTQIPDGGACDDGDQCTSGDVCDANSVCAGTNSPKGTACVDKLFCTAIDECDGNGVCIGHGRGTCPPGWFCDEINDGCLPPV